MRSGHLLVLVACSAVAACDSTKPDPIPASVSVTLAASTLDPGDSTQATATATDASGKPLGTSTATFASSSGSVAQVSTTGRVKAVSDGTANITATLRGVSGSTSLTVYTTVGTVAVTTTRPTIEADDTTRVTTALTSTKGATITGRSISYSSSNAMVATVSSTGLVQGVSAGTADIAAAVEGKSGKVTVTIQTKTAALRASSDSIRLAVQGSAQLTADPLDATGNVLTDRTVTWTVLDPQRTTVASTGARSAQVTWQGPGPTHVIAAVGVARDTVKVSGAGDFAVTAGLFTQGVQDADGSIPMIAGRLPAVLHVLMSSATPTSAKSKVVLRLTNATGAVVFADTQTVLNAIGSSPSVALPSARFVIPATQLVAGRKWQVFRDPMAATPDDDASNDVYPRAAAAALQVVTVPALNVRFVPIVLSAHNNATVAITESDLPGYLRTALSSLPLSQVNTTIGTPFTTNVSFGTAPSGGNSASFWSPLLQELDAARVASSDPSIHWYGVVAPPSGFNFTQTGGIAYVVSDYAANTGSRTRTALGVRTGWFNNQTQARDLVAHELSHNFGRLHTPCGNPSGVDASYPRPDGQVGITMHDVFALATGLSSVPTEVRATTGDIMGYCFPGWSSAYIYSKSLASRTSTPLAIVNDRSRVREPLMVVQGSIATDGTPSFVSPVALIGYDQVASTGAYVLQGLGAGGEVLFERRFDPAIVDHIEERHFTVTIPMNERLSRTQTIRVSGQGRSRVLQLPVSSAPPDVRANVSGVTASCGDLALRVAVQDMATGEVLGIGRGALRVAARPGTMLEVHCAGSRPRRTQWRVR